MTVAAMNAGMRPLELSIPRSGALAKDALTGQFFARNGMLMADPSPMGEVFAGVIVSRETITGDKCIRKRDVSRETSLFFAKYAPSY